MRPAIRQDLELFAYEDWPLLFTIVNSVGTVLDITGASAVWVLKPSPESTTELLRQAGVVATDQVGHKGEVSVLVAKEDNVGFDGILYYELQLTDINELTRKTTYGSITIKPTGIRN
jgi:hypothetical protein